MAIPVNQINVIGSHVYAGSDLALSASLTSAQTMTSTPVSTGTGASVFIITQLSAGSATMKVKQADTAADVTFGSPDQTVALAGTTAQVTILETLPTTTYVGLNFTPGVSGVTFDVSAATKQGIKVLVLYERLDGQEWNNIASSLVMIMSQLNACSHVGDTGPIATGSGNIGNNFAKLEGQL